MQNRSIKQRLCRAKSLDVRRQIVADWARCWRYDQQSIIDQMSDVARRGDMGQMSRLISQMSAVTDKRFAGLASVFDVILSDVGGSDVD